MQCAICSKADSEVAFPQLFLVDIEPYPLIQGVPIDIKYELAVCVDCWRQAQTTGTAAETRLRGIFEPLSNRPAG
jgi:hypothetical protein